VLKSFVNARVEFATGPFDFELPRESSGNVFSGKMVGLS
jgi:hypothetical protein